MTQNQKN